MSWIQWALVSSIVNMTVTKQLPFILLGVAENIPIKRVSVQGTAGVEKIDVVCAILMQLFKNAACVVCNRNLVECGLERSLVGLNCGCRGSSPVKGGNLKGDYIQRELSKELSSECAR